METGEREMRKAFEDVIRNNVKTIADYSTSTRDVVRNLEDEVKELKNMLVTRDSELAALKQQVAIIQGVLYKGGTG